MRLTLAITFLAASLLPVTSHAQTEEGGGGRPVLKPAVGLTWTGVTKDPATGDTSAKAGWQIGGTVLLGEKLYFEGGAFYAKKSTDITATTPTVNVDVTGVSGIRIPVMVGFHVVGDARAPLALRVFGGADMFVVTSVDAQGLSKSDFESPTYGIFAGAGVDFSFVFVDLSYEWSVTDVTKSSTIDVGQSRSFFANVGLRL